MKLLIIMIAVLVVIGGVGLVWETQVNQPGQALSAGVDVATVLQGPASSDFKTATEPGSLEFPADFGAHSDYQLEWWYYTGNLATAENRRFGYQLTIFRNGLFFDDAFIATRNSEWRTNQIWFAHLALTDVEAPNFYHAERFSRGAINLTGAQSDPYAVWLDDWSIREVSPGNYQLQAEAENIALNLQLTPAKPLVLQGDRGLSPKSNEPGNASYYYSFTNLTTQGVVTTTDGQFQVRGKSWKDHEWSTSALADDAVGWDWFSMQFDDDTEVMFGAIRRVDGSAVSVPISGSFVDKTGTLTVLSDADVQVTVLDTWQSPHSGAVYPSSWQFKAPEQDIDVTLTPLLADQELTGSTIYWEGAVEISGSHQGFGYVELTGYHQSATEQNQNPGVERY